MSWENITKVDELLDVKSQGWILEKPLNMLKGSQYASICPIRWEVHLSEEFGFVVLVNSNKQATFIEENSTVISILRQSYQSVKLDFKDKVLSFWVIGEAVLNLTHQYGLYL